MGCASNDQKYSHSTPNRLTFHDDDATSDGILIQHASPGSALSEVSIEINHFLFHHC